MMQRAFEPVQARLLAFDLGFHAPVLEIAHEPPETFASGSLPREEPVPDALHVTRDQIPPRHHHQRSLRAPVTTIPGRAKL